MIYTCDICGSTNVADNGIVQWGQHRGLRYLYCRDCQWAMYRQEGGDIGQLQLPPGDYRSGRGSGIIPIVLIGIVLLALMKVRL